MTIAARVSELGIAEILHFTTSNGALGVLAEAALLPRSQLKDSQNLEFILKHNCDTRKDPAWIGYSSMSISKINSKFMSYSEYQHSHEPDLWWCILAFSPKILSHPGVVFVSGNNTWPRAIKQAGEQGLERMFAASVPGTFGSTITRSRSLPANQPTSAEAEILYPGRLSIDYLTHAYFKDSLHADHFHAQAHTLGVELPDSACIVDEAQFHG